MMTIIEKKITLDDSGATYWASTFNGTVPGPLMVVHEGDYVELTLINPGFVDTPLTQQNDFPMPMRWPVSKAAAYITTRLERRPLEIAFPGPFIAALRLLAVLPQRLQLALGKRMTRPVTEETS